MAGLVNLPNSGSPAVASPLTEAAPRTLRSSRQPLVSFWSRCYKNLCQRI
jgi:hypothetical protein